MKQKGNLWYFESYQEIRNYLAQGLNQMEHFIYLTTRQRAWIGDYGKVVADCNEDGEPYVLTDEDKAAEYHYPDRVVSRLHSIRASIGDIEDYPAEDYAVKKIWQVVCIAAKTVVDGFYKAGEHLEDYIHTVGQKQTRFTTKELTAVKNPVELENDSEDVEYFYRILTLTGVYQCHQDQLWWMMLQMEKAEGVGPAKRHVFTIKEKDAEERKVILRLRFTTDKEVQRIKQCLGNEPLRPFLMYPAIDTAAGIIVGSDGHILTVHKLQGYEQDAQGGLPTWAHGLLSIPKEVCQMKGRVTVTAVEGKWEESVKKDDHSTELMEVEGIIVTATDENGRQGVLKVSTYFRYPNWRKVIPNRIGPAINIDMKKLAEGVKRVMPQLSDASQMMMMSANAGDKSIVLSGEDYDFSKSGSVTVDVIGKMPCGMRVGLKATMVITATGFQVKTMHYKSAGEAFLFVGDNTLTLQMPMVIDDKYVERGPKPTDKQMKRFDIGKWADAPTKDQAKAVSKKGTMKVGTQPSSVRSQTSTAEPTLAERLREALLKQFAKAA